MANSIPSAALGDWYRIEEIKHVLRKHLNAALLESAELAMGLEVVDIDQLITDLRHEFDPINPRSPIQDCFSDAFHAHLKTLRDAGGEPLGTHGELPSGARGGDELTGESK